MNIASLVEIKANPNIPQLAPGDQVKVHTKIIEGEKERTQIFQGTIISLRRSRTGLAFTVRHVAHGIGVERTFPAQSPLVEKVEVVRHGKVRRAKLYYLRGLSGKASRLKERRLEKVGLVPEELIVPEPPAPEPVAEAAPPPAAEAPAQPAPAVPAPEATAPPAPEPPKQEAPKPPEAQQPPAAEPPKA